MVGLDMIYILFEYGFFKYIFKWFKLFSIIFLQTKYIVVIFNKQITG